MGMGVGSMRRVCRGTRSPCGIISSFCMLCTLRVISRVAFSLCPLIPGVGVGFTLGGVRRDWDGDGSWVLLAASWKMSWRPPSDLRVEGCSCGDFMPSSVSVRCAAAAITRSSGVIDGFVKYLCLKKAAPEMRVARVVGVQNFQHR